MTPEKKQPSPEVKKEQKFNNPKIKELEQKLSDVNSAIKDTQDQIKKKEPSIKLLPELNIYFNIIKSLKKYGVNFNDVDRGGMSTFNVGVLDGTLEVDIKGTLFDNQIDNPGFKNIKVGVDRLTKKKDTLKKWRSEYDKLVQEIRFINFDIDTVYDLKKKVEKLKIIKQDLNKEIAIEKEKLLYKQEFPKLCEKYKGNGVSIKLKEKEEFFQNGNDYPYSLLLNNSFGGLSHIVDFSIKSIGKKIMITSNHKFTWPSNGETQVETVCVTIEEKDGEIYSTKSSSNRSGYKNGSFSPWRGSFYTYKNIEGTRDVKGLHDLGKYLDKFKESQIALQKQKEQEDNEHRLDKELKKIRV